MNYRFEGPGPQCLGNPRARNQGPNAWEILERVNGGPIDGFKFFRMGEVNVAGQKVRALRHGMAGPPGLELFGPFEHYDQVRETLLEAGRDLGLLAAGSRTYSTVAHESGWFPSPMPAIYHGEPLKSYREWLPADGFEANISLGGSFVSDNIEDYYLTPFELGYGHIVKFDHDFIGRDALKAMQDRSHRRQVTLRWNKDDVVRVFASLFKRGRPFQVSGYPGFALRHFALHLVTREENWWGSLIIRFTLERQKLDLTCAFGGKCC